MQQTTELDGVPQLSIHAINGIHKAFNTRTMRVEGEYKKRKLYILIDSGSTHNFLDTNLVKNLNCAT